MTHTAMLYLVFERQDSNLGHQIIRKTPIETKTLNQAKAQVRGVARGHHTFVDLVIEEG